MRQRHARLLVAEEDEAAAVESGRRAAAVLVGLADHLRRTCRGAVGRAFFIRHLFARRARAGHEHERKKEGEQLHGPESTALSRRESSTVARATHAEWLK